MIGKLKEKLIIIISAMTKGKHTIGKNNWLPWSIPSELAHFRSMTMGATVIMGRKTYDSVGRPMPKRHNIIISRNKNLSIPGVDVVHTIQEALELAKKEEKEIFIIGGAEIYRQALPLADKMILSFIKQEYDGDTFFPDWNEQEWNAEQQEDRGEWELVVYSRVR